MQGHFTCSVNVGRCSLSSASNREPEHKTIAELYLYLFKVYFSSLLATLNRREKIRSQMNGGRNEVTTLPMSGLAWRNPSLTAGSTQQSSRSAQWNDDGDCPKSSPVSISIVLSFIYHDPDIYDEFQLSLGSECHSRSQGGDYGLE